MRCSAPLGRIGAEAASDSARQPTSSDGLSSLPSMLLLSLRTTNALISFDWVTGGT